jgi:hypothetical protein
LAKIAENFDHNIDPELGEFSSIGRLFTLRNFLKISEDQIFGLLFFQRKSYVFILTKNWLGYILG